MGRPTNRAPERGNARTRLLDAAVDVIREHGYAATSIDEVCRRAQVTKGAFFHHFPSKEQLGVATAEHWASTTSDFFAAAPYHELEDPLERVLGYVAFRRAIIEGRPEAFSCLVGTLVQEVHLALPAVRDACGASILGHAATLEADIEAVRVERGLDGWTAASLARHTQVVIQGAFVVAKAGDDPELAREALDHLDTYLRLLLGAPRTETLT